jgi:hypothetical protein
MASEVKLANPNAVRDLVGAGPLGGVNGLDSEALALELAPAQSFAGGSLTASLRSGFSIRAFNSPDDEDDDNVVGAPPDGAPLDVFRPTLTVDDTSAYLKYKGAVALKVNAAGATLRSLGFELEGEAEMIFSDYHRHQRDTPTRDAVAGDLKSLRCSLRLDDILALGEGEAVAQQLAGRLSATIELAWVDVVSGAAGALVSLLGASGMFALNCSSGVTVSATVSAADDFRLVFSRASADLWRVGLRRARTRTAHLGLALGVKVEVEPTGLQALVDETLEGLFGSKRSIVEKVLAKVDAKKLTAGERALVDKLIDRLGLERSATLDDLRRAADKVAVGLSHAVALTIKFKAEAGFTYAYRRIEETATVFQCAVTKAGLTVHHPALVKGQCAELLQAATGGGGAVRLEHFLFQKTLRVERSWGVALSLGKWTLGSTDRKSLQRVQQFDESRAHRRHAYMGERSYQEAGAKAPMWSVVFAAEMPAFTSEPVPRVADFDVAVSLVWHEEKKKLDDKTLARWIDLAALWGALDEGRLDAAFEECRAFVKQPATCVVQISLSATVFDHALATLAAQGVETLGGALAAAMPWTSEDTGVRGPSGRRRVYEPLWRQVLMSDAQVPGRLLAARAFDHLRAQGAMRLANRERLYQIASERSSVNDASCFGGLVDLNPTTRVQCQAFTHALATLQAKRASGAPDTDVIPRVFEQLEDLWTQSLHVRAVGAHVLDAARSARVMGSVHPSCSLRGGEGGGSAVVFAQ